MSMISQVFGLDDDKHVSEVILDFLLSIGSTDHESNLFPCFNLDEFLAEVIHTQLVEFPKVSFFRYQSYLLNMLLCSNVLELQFLSTMFSRDLLLRPGNSQATIERDSPQSTFPTSP